MTQSTQETDADSQDSVAYSKDYWDLVFEQLGRNNLYKVAVVILTLMYASAIYAPILANDRPYMLEAADYSTYNKALRTIYPATLGLGRVAKQSPEQFREKRSGESEQTYLEALRLESGAVLRQVEIMRASLSVEKAATLVGFENSVIGLRDLAQSTATARTDEVQESLKSGATASKTLVKALRIDFKALDPNQPEEGGLELVGKRSYPILEAISGWEMFFMVLWLALMTWPVWNKIWNRTLSAGDRNQIRKSRKPKLFVAVGLSVACGLLYGNTVGGSSTFTVSGFKAALTSGE
ncbi:MAG: hypothetical protein ACI9F9_000731, partial [Candidatus Paceibacteria bacterium]